MSYLSHLVTSIAISDIDVAAKGLEVLIDPMSEYYPSVLRESTGAAGGDGEPPPDPEDGGSPPNPLEWAHYVCTYSRYLYLNVSKYRCSVGRVQDEIIPMLQKARELVADLKQKSDFSKKDQADLDDYCKNIDLRIKNLSSYT